MVPMPLQRGQLMCAASPIDGRKRWRESSSKPKRVNAADLDARTILFHCIAQTILDRTLDFFCDSMSMKSMTMRPPRSRRRS